MLDRNQLISRIIDRRQELMELNMFDVLKELMEDIDHYNFSGVSYETLERIFKNMVAMIDVARLKAQRLARLRRIAGGYNQ